MGRVDSPLRDRLIFVVGARRSGTNWVQRILGAHPDAVEAPSETYLFSHGIRPLAERMQHAAPGQGRTGFVYMDPDEFRDAARDFCDRVFSGLLARVAPTAQGARLVERTPDHVHHLDLIESIYPDARVVNVVRDGRDVARSLVAQRWGPARIEEAAEEWASAIRAAGDADRGRKLVEVRYEELLADPAGAIAPLYERLGLGSSAEIVEHAVSESSGVYNIDPSSPDIRQEKWREAMSRRELRQFERVAGAELADLGYAESAPTAARSGSRERRVRRGEILRAPLRSLRRRRDSGLARDTLGRAAAAQVVVDGVLSAINTGELERLEALLTPDVHVRVRSGDAEWTGRGTAARERLVATLRDDSVLRGKQVRGDVHPSVPSFFAFSTYELPDGKRAERAAVLTVEGDRVGDLVWYQPPAR